MRFVILFLAVVLCTVALDDVKRPTGSLPEYTADGKLKFPEGYREWVYLTSGFDMSYNPGAQASERHVFDNVFVNPEAYRTFVQSGKWPDKTVMVLEIRNAESKGSINQRGHFQSDAGAVEVHIKDESRFPAKWAFFGFQDDKPASMIPLKADCYTCHAEHGAVDTTFVQFYPTLSQIAKAKGTYDSTSAPAQR